MRNLIHFMTVFYNDEETAGMLANPNSEAMQSSTVRNGIERAVSEFDKSGSLSLGTTMEEALRTSEELGRSYAGLIDGDAITLEWWAQWIKMRGFLAQGKHSDSMEKFRSIYPTFVPENRIMIRQMLDHILTLVAAGASERDLLDILSGDRKKSDALEPLVVALRQRIGETVRAPIEVLEVAQDVRKRIEEAENAGGTAASGRTK